MGRTFRGSDRAKKIEQYRKNRQNRKRKRATDDERELGRDNNRRSTRYESEKPRQSK